MGSPGSLVAPLAEGPLDVVGDVHGELGVLRALLAQLGYDVRGGHPAGRRLVFVGDLCDRGVDSPGVVELVADLVARGRAQCILGNHELNLLREDSKTGNRWLIDPAHPEMADEFAHSRAATPAQAAACRAFLHGLPLALERPDLRVVHAAWHAPAIAELRAWPDAAIACFAHHEARVHDELDACGLRAAAEAERRAHHAALEDRHARPPLLAALGRFDEARQMRNPVRVATSGPERATTAPFWANGKWRMSDRVTWWDAYAEDVPVVVGHYWRLVEPAPAEGEVPTPGREAAAQELSGGKPPLFAAPAHAWVGARANVFCVDFSIGGRYRERRAHRDRGAATPPPYRTRLAAVRWPEQQLVFDDGVTLPLTR